LGEHHRPDHQNHYNVGPFLVIIEKWDLKASIFEYKKIENGKKSEFLPGKDNN